MARPQFTPPDFLQIPWLLIQDQEVKPLDEKVYGFIYWLTCLKGEHCTASNNYIAVALGCTATSVQNALTNLERRGYIARTYTKDDKRNRTEIIPLVRYAKVSLNNDTVSLNNDTQVSLNNDQKKKSNKEEKQNSISVEIGMVIKAFEPINPSSRLFYARRPQRDACQRLLENHSLEWLLKIIQVLPKTNVTKYAPTITSPLQLEEKMAQLVAFIQKEKANEVIL